MTEITSLSTATGLIAHAIATANGHPNPDDYASRAIGALPEDMRDATFGAPSAPAEASLPQDAHAETGAENLPNVPAAEAAPIEPAPEAPAEPAAHAEG